MKISSVLWVAANNFLAEDLPVKYIDGFWQESYSCWAVEAACEELISTKKISRGSSKNHYEKTIDFLEELGVYPSGLFEFDEFVSGEKRQGARYLWLMFAYEVALSEGV